jgi:hypothetical protein
MCLCDFGEETGSPLVGFAYVVHLGVRVENIIDRRCGRVVV